MLSSVYKTSLLYLVFLYVQHTLHAQSPVYDSISKQNNLSIKGSLNIKELREEANRYQLKNLYPQYINTLFLLKREFEDYKDYMSLAHILSEIGDVYYQWGVYEKAVDYYERASDPMYATYLSMRTRQKISLKNGDANRLLGRFSKAQAVYESMLSTWENELTEKEKATIATHLSNICKKTQQYDQAAQYEKKVLGFQLALHDSLAIANAYNNLGAIHKKLNANAEALSYFIKAYTYYPQKMSTDNLAIILLNIGIAYQAEDDYVHADEHFFKALELNKIQNNPEETARVYNYIASNYLFLKEYDQAIAYAEKAEAIAKPLHLFDILEINYRILWQAHELQHDSESALHSYRLYVVVKDTLLLRNKNAKEELVSKLREAEKLESRIQTLLSENELQHAELNRVQLESRHKLSEIELIRQSNELREIRSKQLQLEQQQEIDRLELVEQTWMRKSKDRELSLLKQRVLIENREKQTKMEALHQQNKINKLEISQKEIALKNQRLVQYLLLLALIGGSALTFLLFNRYKLTQKAIKERLKRKNTEVEQRFLRAQMNPHFIFNALNSIQYYITSHDNSSAARYLSKFSKLIRHILESSRHQFISLGEEIKILNVYLELEQLRFADKFDYVITIDESLEDDFIGIPPMITQPYIENAILHGIIPGHEKGTIHISFVKEADCIVSTISDNGIGRAASTAIQQGKKNSHKSLAMELTRDRLELMKQNLKGEYNIAIHDLKDNKGQACGTEVKLWIPYVNL